MHHLRLIILALFEYFCGEFIIVSRDVIFNSSWNWDNVSESTLKPEQEKLVDTGEGPVEGEINQGSRYRVYGIRIVGNDCN